MESFINIIHNRAKLDRNALEIARIRTLFVRLFDHVVLKDPFVFYFKPPASCSRAYVCTQHEDRVRELRGTLFLAHAQTTLSNGWASNGDIRRTIEGSECIITRGDSGPLSQATGSRGARAIPAHTGRRNEYANIRVQLCLDVVTRRVSCFNRVAMGCRVYLLPFLPDFFLRTETGMEERWSRDGGGGRRIYLLCERGLLSTDLGQWPNWRTENYAERRVPRIELFGSTTLRIDG